jgi:putative ATP-dependent endonuclease of OLD family
MRISEIRLINYKIFEGLFSLKLNSGMNILVGDNEAGKSTIIEAVNLALSGLVGGRYIKNELSQYLFNNNVVEAYFAQLRDTGSAELPYVLIELYLEGDDTARFMGNDNSQGINSCGIFMKIAFDEKYQAEYEELVKVDNFNTLPLEYYDVFWGSFAREAVTARSIPLKAALIDSSSARFQNGSDVYISRIIKDLLNTEDIVAASQAHRRMRDVFNEDKSIITINEKIKEAADVSSKEVRLSVDLSSKNAWETTLLTYFDDVPFHHIGKGEQSMVKTKLALNHHKSKEANIILVEEPENHLSHTKLSQLVKYISAKRDDKQIIVSTHNSFVANKLGLANLILLNDCTTVRLNELSNDTQSYFAHLSGYDTLRLILCKKAILVEGDSDELVVQRAYMTKHEGKLPIEDGVDVISVGTSFLRFLEIASKINKLTTVVTDNDGNVDALKRKYTRYLGDNVKDNILISFDDSIDTGPLKIKDKAFNYNTLEPKMLKANSLAKLNTVFGTAHSDDVAMHKFMLLNKTECALKIFETDEDIIYPKYIMDAIN